MHLTRFAKNHIRFIGFLALILCFYNEFLVYILNYLSWPTLPKIQLDDQTGEKPLRFLLVADPQLIGENDEPWYFDWIARWDSDRYLRNTFMLANSYVKPDIIIFLGDLFDEGLKSNDAQFERYFRRFNTIFQTEKLAKRDKIQLVYISGDNDIGGEYVNDRNDELAYRFEKYFGPMIDVINVNKFIELIKLDLDYTISFYNSVKRNFLLSILNNKQRVDELKSDNNKKFTIILNHMSLLYKTKQELKALNEDTNAGLIIKGDSHLFQISKYNYVSQRIVEKIDYKIDPSNYYILNLQHNKQSIQSIYELSIPTCSYRMGVPNMGYGLMTFTPHGKAYISILWSPSRYQSIFYYLIFLFLISVYFLIIIIVNRLFRLVVRSLISKIA